MHLWHGGGRVCDIKAGKTKEFGGITAHMWSSGDRQGGIGRGGVCGSAMTGRWDIGRGGVTHRR